MDSFNSRWLLNALLATIDRARNIDPTPLPVSETMITGPDWSRNHMIATAMSRRSIRAAGGLRRPSQSHSSPTFPLTIYLMMCAGPNSQPIFATRFLPDATSYKRSEDNCPQLWNPRIWASLSASVKRERFHIFLISEQFWPVKVCVSVVFS